MQVKSGHQRADSNEFSFSISRHTEILNTNRQLWRHYGHSSGKLTFFCCTFTPCWVILDAFVSGSSLFSKYALLLTRIKFPEGALNRAHSLHDRTLTNKKNNNEKKIKFVLTKMLIYENLKITLTTILPFSFLEMLAKHILIITRKEKSGRIMTQWR